MPQKLKIIFWLELTEECNDNTLSAKNPPQILLLLELLIESFANLFVLKIPPFQR